MRRDTPLEIEHIVARSKGGSNRPSNLGIACIPCNRKKGNLTLEAFVKDPVRLAKIRTHMRTPLADAAAVNSTRFALQRSLQASGLPVTTASGGRTKFNRKVLGVPKTHSLDAACVGEVSRITGWRQPVLTIRCAGRGVLQADQANQAWFPARLPDAAEVGLRLLDRRPRDRRRSGRQESRHASRTRRHTGIWIFQHHHPIDGVIQGISHRHCRLLQRSDGYGYAITAA